MTKKMLIDALHVEEVRVAVVAGGRLEEFDFETAAKKQIKGNIYLAKVTRVEPSLQAAFVEYGGNKQGFLPFSEVHFDYYQIPVSDKNALKQKASAEVVDSPTSKQAAAPDAKKDEVSSTEEDKKAEDKKPAAKDKTKNTKEDKPEESLEEEIEGEEVEALAEVEAFGEEDFEVPIKRSNLYRKYKIQEVIKRNQILLVQVIKEERGNKGASLTTYISLAGRYCVLMPNTDRQGGVSRRISTPDDRKRLKQSLSELNIIDGASVIIRTAGIDRKKPEIKRDYEYLKKLWDNIRELTVSSTAPSMVYEEGDLVKRSIRDLYDNSIDEVLIEGEQAFENARKFMKMMMPSHVKKVVEYKESAPLFWKNQIEDQLAELYENQASLKSGGSIVINPTEALVSIDVNSGKFTKERNIEETALKTNLEAAAEIARQLRLRDLAGLIVIDFIDMLEFRNKRSVERALKDALATDRARIQVGRISSFGLLEMSRQRMRSSIVETNTMPCPTCHSTGYVRSRESTSVLLLRTIESEAHKGKGRELFVRVPHDAAFYTLNNKRENLSEIEKVTGVKVHIKGDYSLSGIDFAIEKPRHSNSRRAGSDNFKNKRRGGRQDNRTRQERPDDKPAREEKEGEKKFTPRSDRQNKRGGRWQKRDERPQNNGNETPVPSSKDGNTAPPQPKEEKKPEKDHVKEAPAAAKTPPRENVEEVAALAEQRKDEESVLRGLWKKMTQ